MPSIELIFAEFGDSRSNAGATPLPTDRLEPSLSSFRKHFPKAEITVFTDQDWSSDKYNTVKVNPMFEKRGRYGWRCNDYYQAIGLLESKADIAIAVDSDLLIVDNDVKAIVPLAETFGLCMAINGRFTVKRDARSDSDGGTVDDPSRGLGTCHATAFWAFNPKSTDHRVLLEAYAHKVIEGAQRKIGARGPLALWRAQWATGVPIYTLPLQWCVTGSNLGKGGEIILHVGQRQVADHYGELIQKWMPR